MSFFARFARRSVRPAVTPASPPAAKASRVGPLIAWSHAGRPVWTPRDYTALAREGFQSNAVVHRAVRMVAEAAAGVPLLLFDGRRELTEHPLLSLLARPNPRDGKAAFLEAVFGHLLLAGNAYVEQVAVDGDPRELYALRPDRMKVVPGADGWPEAWDYTANGRTLRFARLPDDRRGVQPILHLTLFHPLDDHYGLSPVEAAATALDIHNAAGAWNKALLDNAARPSGALVYAGPQGSNLSEEQVERLKAELEAAFQGAANAGRPMLLEGGLDWKPLSMTPKDMDFAASKAAAAREIALAFGVPPMMLGLPGDNTFANYAEANRSFWRQTVLPLVARSAESLVHWLGPAYGEASGLRLEPDLDRIDALAGEREALWSRIGAADFLTADEKRAAVGYGAADGAAMAGGAGAGPPGPGRPGRKFRPDQPRVPAGGPGGGQWTGGQTGSGGETAPDPGQAGSEWTAVQRVDTGGITGEIVRSADGTLIRHETDPSAEHGWTERNVVTLPDGTAFQFRTEGDTQVVANGNGQEISRTTWTSAGPVPVETVQPAFAPAAPSAKLAIDAAVVLLGWMALRDTTDERAVASFRAYESDASGQQIAGVARIDRDRVDRSCPRLGEVQSRLDEAFDRVWKNQPDLSPSQFGTAVHLDLANQIRDLGDPNFLAEESYFKTGESEAYYGARGSVRVDVLENVDHETVCVYDIKTGGEVVRPGRAAEIAQAVKTKFGTAKRIIVTEIRPGH